MSVGNLMGEMLILFLEFLLVYLHSVRAWLLQVLLVSAFVRLAPGSRFDKNVVD